MGRFLRCSGHILVCGLLALTFSCAGGQKPLPAGEADALHLVLLHTNDHHGHPAKFLYRHGPGVGGLPARATLVKEMRRANKHVLLLDAGDLNTGMPVSNLFHARPDIEGYNALGYDAMAIGNHEFDNAMDILLWQDSWAHFPFLSANIKTREGRNLGRPYIIKSFDGVRVALFGLTTKRTEVIGNQENIRDLVFEDEVAVAKALVPSLREKADVVIALVHLGIYGSTDMGSERLASEVGGIDLIVDGHSHTRLDDPLVVEHRESDWKTPIVQAWKWGLLLGKVDLWVRGGKVVRLGFNPVPINLKQAVKGPDGTEGISFVGQPIQEDPFLLKTIAPYERETDAALSEVVGVAEGAFLNGQSRRQETAIGDLVADSMRWKVMDLGVDFAIQNGGGIRADLPEGNITKAMVYAMLPFNNRIVVLTMKGSDVQALFDFIGTILPGQGAFPQVSEGVRFTINRTNGGCEDILIGGTPIDPNRDYRIVTNQYLAGGGDGYKIFLRAHDRRPIYETQKHVFNQYLKALGGRIRPSVGQRIRLIEKKDAETTHKIVEMRGKR